MWQFETNENVNHIFIQSKLVMNSFFFLVYKNVCTKSYLSQGTHFFFMPQLGLRVI